MEYVKLAKGTVTVVFDYTQSINELIDEGDIETEADIENTISDWLKEAIRDITIDNSKITLTIE